MKTKTFLLEVLVALIIFSGFFVQTAYGQACPAISFFSQKNPSWSGDLLGDCSGNTIGNAGCAVTSIAMIIRYYDYACGVDPKLLNNWLKKQGCYNPTCKVFWQCAAGYSQKVTLETPDPIITSDLTKLDPYLNNLKPVIVKVINPKTGNDHYVIAAYKYQGSYYIFDPADTALTKKTLATYNNRIYQIVVYGRAKAAPGINALALTSWANMKIAK